MAETSTTENVRAWLRTCPVIPNNVRFNVDFMEDAPVQYALYSSPTTMDYGTDVLGEVYVKPIQELNYIFQALFYYSKDIRQNLDNLDFFTKVVDWIYQQNARKNFPQIAQGKVLSIMPTLSPYVYDADSDSGRYQIQLKIRYRRKPDTERTINIG